MPTVGSTAMRDAQFKARATRSRGHLFWAPVHVGSTGGHPPLPGTFGDSCFL